jgi:hypothetical protein
MELRAAWNRRNSHVLKILPVTTFRTIDLEGKKNSSLLFSRFCEELGVFFRVPQRADNGCRALGIQEWEGHGFSRATKTSSVPALAAEGGYSRAKDENPKTRRPSQL